jgi:hypothetical protein
VAVLLPNSLIRPWLCTGVLVASPGSAPVIPEVPITHPPDLIDVKTFSLARRWTSNVHRRKERKKHCMNSKERKKNGTMWLRVCLDFLPPPHTYFDLLLSFPHVNECWAMSKTGDMAVGIALSPCWNAKYSLKDGRGMDPYGGYAGWNWSCCWFKNIPLKSFWGLLTRSASVGPGSPRLCARVYRTSYTSCSKNLKFIGKGYLNCFCNKI